MTNGVLTRGLSAVLLLLSAGSNAATVYKYIGNNYTDFWSSPSTYSTSMAATGSFTVDSPLIDVSGDISSLVTSYSFSDGVTTYSNADPEGSAQFIVNVDSSGNFIDWIVDIFDISSLSPTLVPGDVVSRIILRPSSDEAQVYECDFVVVTCVFSQIDGAAVYDQPGSWSVVPTPAVAWLVAAGFLSLVSFARSKSPIIN